MSVSDTCTDALLLVRGLDAGEAMTEQYQPVRRALNRLLKSLMTKGMIPYLKQETILFPVSGTARYTLGNGATDAEWCVATDNVNTTTTAAAASGASAIDVTSVTGMTAADRIGIELDDGTRQWTTIASISTLTINLDDTLTAAVASGNEVFTYTDRPQRPLRITHARRKTNQTASDVPVEIISHEQYFDESEKTGAGTVTQLYYNPKLTQGDLYLWQTSGNATTMLGMTVESPIDDADDTTDTLRIPAEGLDAIVYNLAMRIEPAWGHLDANRAMMLTQQAQMLMREWESHALDHGPMRIVPARQR